MRDFKRGAYEPGEDVRVFDGSEDEEDIEGSRLPLLIVLALLMLAMFAGVVWLAYTQGVARGRGETPVVTAAAGPARVAPTTPGGATQPYQGFKIYEQPAPPDDDSLTDSKPAAAAKPVPTVAPKPVPTPPAPTAPAPKPAAPVQTAQALKAAPAAPVKAAPPPAKPSAPVQTAQAKPAPAPAKLAPAPAKPVPVKASPAPVAAAPAAAPAAAAGSPVLQIGAYKSQAEADAAWKAYQAKHATLLAGYGPDVARADLGDKGVWYRLRIAGFPSKDVASALCDRLKADGGACFLGK